MGESEMELGSEARLQGQRMGWGPERNGRELRVRGSQEELEAGGGNLEYRKV